LKTLPQTRLLWNDDYFSLSEGEYYIDYIRDLTKQTAPSIRTEWHWREDEHSIGTGNFGTVRKGFIGHNKMIAVKKIPIPHGEHDQKI
jgi:hypothetical protein